MVRIIIKGGIWRNTEDEILKAAISKYGKNQWARISSLLTEDEKLLHLAKLMPTQWRTIAPIVGRTATQCLERYQKLLDEAEAKENDELGLSGPGGPEAGPSADDVRRLRPGEVDPDPETKPARPDPIDMDEDEKEMLSEARARLANTQGKKAKRKARERQLEEARRLAVLQKKRELKAAGIMTRSKPKNKKNAMDYNEDIPFNKQPAPGFYDTTDEKNRRYAAPIGQALAKLEGKRKNNNEEDEAAEKRKKAKSDNAKANPTFVAAREAQIQKLKEAEQIGTRRRLDLPAPQVGEVELEEIVKIGQAGERSRELVEGEGGDEASGRLLGDYESLGKAKMARTPRTAPQQDNIMAEARNLRNMIHTQTPLLGDENTPLHQVQGGTGFEGATPLHQVASTPNPLATPFRGTGGVDFGATPRSEAGSSVSSTPLRTPMRDSLNINSADGGMTPAMGDTPAQARRRAKDLLRRGFASLPKAQNDFEIALPEEEIEEEVEEAPLSEEDAAERDAKLQRLAEEEAAKALKRRSQAVQKNLPRPANVDVDGLLGALSLEFTSTGDDALDRALRLVDQEFVQLVEHDSIVHPVPGTSRAGGASSTYELPEDDDLATARSLIHSELANSLGFPGANEETLKRGILSIATESGIDSLDDLSWSKTRESLCYSASASSWVEAGSVSSSERIEGYAARILQDRELMIAEATKATKTEKKLSKVLGGYQVVNAKIQKRIVDAYDDLQRTQRELESFSSLFEFERAAAPRRIEGLQIEVDKMLARERDLQMKYAELDRERRERRERVQAAEEEKMIADAEAALEAQEAAEQQEEAGSVEATA
ncbi:mRNA splicing protein CDC5 (Myb superfamily) [Phaffia rhodozyma]|uniref:mRNA splicing protein CDC5 (Myb superfamily) n=1 Tax=Phaffia rhodozyma TaxID=264483 RepID=A0A0F7STF4_PHARH|nr:mRNA splicing protein CDC5 (Myb superfamily) [Phaffia rhodozyma]